MSPTRIAKARLLKFPSIEVGPSATACEAPFVLSRVIESNIFDVSHCRRSETGSVLPRTRMLDVLHKLESRAVRTPHRRRRPPSIWMAGIISAPGIVVQLKNAINLTPLLLLRRICRKPRSHRCRGPIKLRWRIAKPILSAPRSFGAPLSQS